MKIIKDNVSNENKKYAIDILNKLKIGNRTFGAPAEGLKKTLKELENNAPKKDSIDDISFKLDDKSYAAEVSKIKKGIKGEELLAQYFEKVIRLDKVLSDIIIFASLGDENTDKDYIPDTDFLLVYGNNLLIVDAKNINTNPDMPIFVDGNGIYTAMNHDDPLIEVNSSIPVWKKILSEEYNGTVNSINGCTCIINKSGATVFKDENWVKSYIKPIHISELVDFLHMWVEEKEPVFDINLLVTIMKKQIYKPKSDMDLTIGKRLLGV